MISWWKIAECIYKSTLISAMADQAGMDIHPIMCGGPDGLQILLEQKRIVAGWEVRN